MEYGLIAERLSHSFSKEVHSRLADYFYELKELNRQELDAFMKNKDFKAINVTIPYKEAVIPYLDEIDSTALLIGAVNTVVNKDGKLYGYNTDFAGMTAMCQKSGISFKDKKVLILGSGGTSKTSFAVAKSLGARCILGVSRKKSENFITYEEAYRCHKDADIIINTTPCGMYPDIEGSAIDISDFKNLSGVVDAVYNPLKTTLCQQAEKMGIKAVGGLFMLVSQAVFACEHFLSKELEKDTADKVYKDILASKQNVVFVGMPASGKSTVGKLVAQKLGREFFDTDLLIEEKTGLHPSVIIKEQGEKVFRDIEAQVIREVSVKSGIVIATGGGAILRQENIDNLHKNGLIWFIDRDLSQLHTTADRPLSSTKEDLLKRYNERYPIYTCAADFILKDLETPEKAAEQTVKDLYL